MKKLMIAAAVAAMGAGAFAGLCDNKGDASDCALYDVKFTFKSLDTKRAVLKDKDACTSGTTCCTYLDNATYTFNGIMWDCNAVCDTLDPNNSNGGAKLVLWYAKAKAVISAPLTWGDSDNDGTYEWEGDLATFAFINRFSKKATKVQAYWEQDFNAQYLAKYVGYNTFGANDEVKIRAAGFGTFDNKKMYVKSISGNAVATIGDVLLKEQNCGYNGPEPLVYDLCTEFDTVCDGAVTDVVAASGTWSVKYNKSLSNGKKTLNQIVPAYAYDK